MKVMRKVEKMQIKANEIKNKGKTIGLIPTMGALHEGHLSLIRKARAENDVVVVSIFVNPKQFTNTADLAHYPRALERDKKLIAPYVDYLFDPQVTEMYPAGFETSVSVSQLSADLEGVYRPGHFEGMATVVLKLLHICQPTRAYFGLKDYQQYMIVTQMVRDLALGVEIMGVPTVREDGGLALSSRNMRLSSQEKVKAQALYRALQKGKEMIAAGEHDPRVVVETVVTSLEKEGGIGVDYVAIRDAHTFQPVTQIEHDVVILVAAHVGDVRLIDNLIVIIGNHVSSPH